MRSPPRDADRLRSCLSFAPTQPVIFLACFSDWPCASDSCPSGRKTLRYLRIPETAMPPFDRHQPIGRLPSLLPTSLFPARHVQSHVSLSPPRHPRNILPASAFWLLMLVITPRPTSRSASRIAPPKRSLHWRPLSAWGISASGEKYKYPYRVVRSYGLVASNRSGIPGTCQNQKSPSKWARSEPRSSET